MMERRIDIIRREATKLFLRQGYAKTQISHIAVSYTHLSLLANKLIVRRGDVFAHGTKRFLRHDFDGGAGKGCRHRQKEFKIP